MSSLYKYTYVTSMGRGTHFTNTIDRKTVYREIRLWEEGQRQYNSDNRVRRLRVYGRRPNKA